MKKCMITVTVAFVAVFIFFTSSKSANAAATLGILPTDSGTVGA